MQADTVVCGILVDHRGVLGEGCVAARGGLVTGIHRKPVSAERVLDYRGMGVYVSPGFIDMHVHLRGLRLDYKEDERSGTAAAASAGITLVADMPNTVPRLSTPEALEEKLRALRKRSLVDYAVYAGVPDSPGLVEELASLPVAGFKIYPGDLEERMEAVKRILELPGALVVVHPELPEAEKPVAESNSLRAVHRGCHWEAAAVQLLRSLEPRARLHITHASCPSTIEHARNSGFTVDVAPHHLLLQGWGEDCLYRVNPPLRSSIEEWRLLQTLLEAGVNAVASDHAPHAAWEKTEPLTCSPGIAWLEAWPSLLYCLVEAGALRLEEFLRLAGKGPADILGLRGYGVLEPGARADLAAWRPASTRIGAPRWSKARLVPYFMERGCMEVLATLVGGVPVYVEGELTGEAEAVNPFERSRPG